MARRVINVTDYSYADGTPRLYGRVILENGKISLEGFPKNFLEEVVEDGVPYKGKLVKPYEEPEKFIKAIMIEWNRGRSKAEEEEEY